MYTVLLSYNITYTPFPDESCPLQLTENFSKLNKNYWTQAVTQSDCIYEIQENLILRY